MRVELALPMVNDSLYEKDVVAPGEFGILKSNYQDDYPRDVFCTAKH